MTLLTYISVINSSAIMLSVILFISCKCKRGPINSSYFPIIQLCRASMIQSNYITISTISQYQLYHNINYITISTISQYQLYHNINYITISTISQYQLYHNINYITISTISQYQLYYKSNCQTLDIIMCYSTL